MNYQKHYDLLIQSRKEKCTFSDYYEKHHIIPKCMGGSDKQINLVQLTAREHYIAHWLLTKIYPENVSLKYAFYRSSMGNLQERKLTPKQYERVRILFAKTKTGFKHSEETKRKISEKVKGFKHTEEAKRKIGEASKNRAPISEETRAKLSLAGTNISEETRKKRSLAQTGKKYSDEARKKMSESAKRKPPMSEETKRKISEKMKEIRKRKV